MRSLVTILTGLLLAAPAAFALEPVPTQTSPPPAAPAVGVTPQQAQALLSSLRSALASQIRAGDASVGVNEDRIRVRMQVVNDIDHERVGEVNTGLLNSLAGVINSSATDWGIEVQGHSSTAPHSEAEEERIAQQRTDFVTREVTQRLLGHTGPIISRSMGSWHPVMTNSSEEGQRMNDRIEIWLLPPGWPSNFTPGLFPPSEDEAKQYP